MRPLLKVLRRILAGVAAGALLLCVVAAAILVARMRSALPVIDGALPLPGLSGPVAVARDAHGVPTIAGASRVDVARATGLVHAQDRFFQMDLMRRRAAGELAALIGPAAVGIDRASRVHGFRGIARESLARLGPADRALVQAYTDGVNAGLAGQAAAPFEYLLLRSSPEPWRPEDCLLVACAMFLQLQDDQGRYERDLGLVNGELGPEALAFLAPLETAGDAALDGSRGSPAPVPGPSVIDLRRNAAAPGEPVAALGGPRGVPGDGEPAASNAIAISGAHAAGGAALVGNDMHLHLGVPDIWYRACLEWGRARVTGLTLPGLPFVLAGSNGRVAWGFTTGCSDTSDRVIIEPTSSPDLYRVQGRLEAEAVTVRHERIVVRGAPAVEVDYRWTRWGPLVGMEKDGRPVAMRWTAPDPAAIDLGRGRREEAGSVREAVDIAHDSGCPSLALVAADASGSIAWTVAGRLPRRTHFTGRLPANWSFGDRNWDGYVAPADVPTLINPPQGRLWSANERPVGGDALGVLGDGGYAQPARARQLQGDLDALVRRAQKATPADLLQVELDDRGLMLADWRGILLGALDDQAVAGHPDRAALRGAAGDGPLAADVGNAAYRIVRLFHDDVAMRVFTPIFAPCADEEPGFNWKRFNYEQPLRTILRERPAHLLDPAYGSWDDLLLASADAIAARLHREGVSASGATWGHANRASIRHPLGAFLPRWLTLPLDMPADPLAGDTDMPRVQSPDYGASERFAVAPGREEEGVFEMPAGQSGNPASPFYRAGHGDWVSGAPSPFLPGPAAHTLRLLP